MKTTREPHRSNATRLSGSLAHPPEAADLLYEERTQLLWLASREAAKRLSAQQRAMSRARVQARIDLLRQIPARATHLAETAPSEDGTWTLWTVQAWLHYSLLTHLAAIGTIRPVRSRRFGAPRTAGHDERAVVAAAAAACGIDFDDALVDVDTGAPMLRIHATNGYTRRFLIPAIPAPSSPRLALADRQPAALS